MASALKQDDQRTYQRLLDQYNTAKAAEDTAEQIRQTQASLAESRRQFDEQQRTAKASASGSGYDLSSIAKYLTTPKATESNDDRYKKWLATQLSVKPISSLVVSGSKNNKVQGSNVKLQGGGPALQSGGIKLQGKGATTQKLITKPSTSRLRVT